MGTKHNFNFIIFWQLKLLPIMLIVAFASCAEIQYEILEKPPVLPRGKELMCFLDTITIEHPVYIGTETNCFIADSSQIKYPIANIDSFINNNLVYYYGSDSYMIFMLNSVLIKNKFWIFTDILFDQKKDYGSYRIGNIKGTHKFAVYLLNVEYCKLLWERETMDNYEKFDAVSNTNEYIKMAFPLIEK